MGVSKNTAEQASTRTVESKEQKAVGNSRVECNSVCRTHACWYPTHCWYTSPQNTTATDAVPGSASAAALLPSTRSPSYLPSLIRGVPCSCSYAVGSGLQVWRRNSSFS